MLSSVLAPLARIRVTLTYAVAVAAVTTALEAMGPRYQDLVIRHASTNLHNLSHGRLGTLVSSALVVDAGPVYVWLPGLACLLALAELLWRSWRLILAFAVGHVGATLLVAVGLTAAVKASWLPVSVARATDVGMSYGAAAVLGTVAAAIPRRWRPAWIGWWLAVAVTVVYFDRDFTDVGHAVALMLGMLVGARFGEPERWTPVLAALLVIGGGFGYLLLTGTGPLGMVAGVSGLIGAAVAGALGRVRVTSDAPAARGDDLEIAAQQS